ncbi:amino-acid N-acetyltransferas-like protein subunit Mak10 [Dothidotthia symphoricarpi CBS 119687]|uniref:Amino-acid N-acetyltransferas-like protein subunit Mak10 n=1 Tax=Dothidotthia symphoricarpi CBS 119687 TaxID=1392245 RepID=A0A6A6AF71_9PLEO|nr:amino-acid N-acetyltransferas-like protein subunit Mak10 [Dothidotthia symphoricarpi CBS 119687]KAF2129061.1 amino-acid N-acetyltransferas-like protein subunit Mak10 [Dothidotthia symphoricarpi CBS 119687]
MSHRHSTASDQDPDAISTYDGAAPSHVENSVSTAQASKATTNLPLRQALRKPVPGLEPKIHDITAKFTRACTALQVGQLIKDEYFTLFESIGAIEIMDAKMDSGYLQPGETLDDDYDTLKPLLPEELIGIMDQLLCHEMAWHTGYPLSQTLFTSVYMDKLLWPEPKTLEQAQFYRGDISDENKPGTLLEVLRAYCLALIKGCDFVIAKITSRDYFEEEDFCTNTYNRVLFVSIPMDVFLRELDAAMEVMEDKDLQIEDTFRSAIISRLEFRKDLLRAMDLDCSLEHMSYSWPPVLKGIDMFKATHELGKVVPSAFSPKIQRKLAATVPPRPIVELGFEDALEKLQQMSIDCEEATRFITLGPDPLEYQSFLWTFASRLPAPLSYSRSYLATLLFHPEILQTSTSLPLADVSSLVFPSSPCLDPINWSLSPPRNPLLPKPPRLQLAMLMDEFVDRSGQPYLDLWVALGQNRCRLRRMLSHVVAGWDLLQADASLVDTDITRTAEELGISDQILEFSLSTWAYHKKLWMIEKILLLGFEQEIYLPDEFAGMYLFLSLIATRRKELLKRVEIHYLTRSEQLLQARRLRETQDVEDATPYLDSLFVEAGGIASLSLALARFYMVLLYLGLLPTPKRPFSTEELRYELRMKPFHMLQPPEVPAFDDFQTHTQPYGAFSSPASTFYSDLQDAKSDVWSEIDTSLKAAKGAFAEMKKLGAKAAKAEGVEKAWVKEVQSALASCIALGVAVAGVKNAVLKKDIAAGEDMGIKVEVPEAGTGKRYAEGWVVAKVSNK